MPPLPQLSPTAWLCIIGCGLLVYNWPKIAKLWDDSNADGKPDMDLSKLFGEKADCASKILEAAKCLDKVEDATIREQLAQAAVKKILEER